MARTVWADDADLGGWLLRAEGAEPYEGDETCVRWCWTCGGWEAVTFHPRPPDADDLWGGPGDAWTEEFTSCRCASDAFERAMAEARATLRA